MDTLIQIGILLIILGICAVLNYLSELQKAINKLSDKMEKKDD